MQRFIIPGRLPGYNELKSKCWQASMRVKNEAMNRVQIHALSIKPIRAKAVITIACFEPNAKRDPDNVQSGAAKIILDALQRCGKLANDNRRHVELHHVPVEVDRVDPRIVVSIEAVTEAKGNG